MPKQSKKSDLASVLGVAGHKAFEVHKADDVTYSTGAELPAGIEGGVAQLVDCRFAPIKTGSNRGEYGFIRAGIVVAPKECGGIPIEGLRTSPFTEPMCNTPGKSRETIKEHICYVINELKKLGADTSDASLGDLEGIAAALMESQPYFRFRTWKGRMQTEGPYAGQEPRIKHEWLGTCDYEPNESSSVVDSTADAVEEEPEEEEAETPDAIDLLATAAKADNGDSDAEAQMVEAAEAAGIDHTTYQTWEDVVHAISEQGSDEGESEEEEGEEYEEETPWQPEKGEYYYYKPPRARKRIECEITAVLIGKQTCSLASTDGSKAFKGVPWGKLEEE